MGEKETHTNIRASHLFNIPLVTALPLGLNYIPANIVNDIRQANQALENNPNDWRAVSEMFINAFNEFSQSINEVLEECSGKTTPNGHFLWTSTWGKGRLIPKNWVLSDFMSEKHNQTLEGCYLGTSFWIKICCNCTNLTTALCFNSISFAISTIHVALRKVKAEYKHQADIDTAAQMGYTERRATGV